MNVTEPMRLNLKGLSSAVALLVADLMRESTPGLDVQCVNYEHDRETIVIRRADGFEAHVRRLEYKMKVLCFVPMMKDQYGQYLSAEQWGVLDLPSADGDKALTRNPQVEVAWTEKRKADAVARDLFRRCVLPGEILWKRARVRLARAIEERNAAARVVELVGLMVSGTTGHKAIFRDRDAPEIRVRAYSDETADLVGGNVDVRATSWNGETMSLSINGPARLLIEMLGSLRTLTNRDRQAAHDKVSRKLAGMEEKP